MTTETMTVHEALCELKTMDKRIAKALGECKFATTNRHYNQKITGIPLKEFCDQQAENYQSANDLIRRRNAIKCAVVRSNAVAVVNICGTEMTVAEAIDMKNNGIGFQNLLYNTMSSQLKLAQTVIERENGDALQRRADQHIEATYGRQTDMKTIAEDVRRDREQFIVNQSMELVQPTGVDLVTEMKRLDKEITEFNTKVDAALSVSNATTTIKIEY